MKRACYWFLFLGLTTILALGDAAIAEGQEDRIVKNGVKVFSHEEDLRNLQDLVPSLSPSFSPTISPSNKPSLSPTTSPSKKPTISPTTSPSKSPTKNPSTSPTKNPTTNPTSSPSKNPTLSPTSSPTKNPTSSPSKNPTTSPSTSPTKNPTTSPTKNPTKLPTTSPSRNPTSSPSTSPTRNPTTSPTKNPTLSPTTSPTLTSFLQRDNNLRTTIVVSILCLLCTSAVIFAAYAFVKRQASENMDISPNFSTFKKISPKNPSLDQDASFDLPIVPEVAAHLSQGQPLQAPIVPNNDPFPDPEYSGPLKASPASASAIVMEASKSGKLIPMSPRLRKKPPSPQPLSAEPPASPSPSLASPRLKMPNVKDFMPTLGRRKQMDMNIEVMNEYHGDKQISAGPRKRGPSGIMMRLSNHRRRETLRMSMYNRNQEENAELHPHQAAPKHVSLLKLQRQRLEEEKELHSEEEEENESEDSESKSEGIEAEESKFESIKAEEAKKELLMLLNPNEDAEERVVDEKAKQELIDLLNGGANDVDESESDKEAAKMELLGLLTEDPFGSDDENENGKRNATSKRSRRKRLNKSRSTMKSEEYQVTNKRVPSTGVKGLLSLILRNKGHKGTVVGQPQNIQTIEFDNERIRPVISRGDSARSRNRTSSSMSLRRRLDF